MIKFSVKCCDWITLLNSKLVFVLFVLLTSHLHLLSNHRVINEWTVQHSWPNGSRQLQSNHAKSSSTAAVFLQEDPTRPGFCSSRLNDVPRRVSHSLAPNFYFFSIPTKTETSCFKIVTRWLTYLTAAPECLIPVWCRDAPRQNGKFSVSEGKRPPRAPFSRWRGALVS